MQRRADPIRCGDAFIALGPRSTAPGYAEKSRRNIRSYYSIGWIRCESREHEIFPAGQE